jgi:mono/diheme cytochrome c family protein
MPNIIQKWITIILLILQSFLILSCSGKNKAGHAISSVDKANPVIKPQALTKDLEEGLDIYKHYCLSCHQQKGNGVSGMYPPLAGNSELKGSVDSLITIVLRGKAGRVEINGNVYSGIMASHNYLTDAQVADVLNYILNGMNKFNLKIDPSEVFLIRKMLK